MDKEKVKKVAVKTTVAKVKVKKVLSPDKAEEKAVKSTVKKIVKAKTKVVAELPVDSLHAVVETPKPKVVRKKKETKIVEQPVVVKPEVKEVVATEEVLHKKEHHKKEVKEVKKEVEKKNVEHVVVAPVVSKVEPVKPEAKIEVKVEVKPPVVEPPKPVVAHKVEVAKPVEPIKKPEFRHHPQQHYHHKSSYHHSFRKDHQKSQTPVVPLVAVAKEEFPAEIEVTFPIMLKDLAIKLQSKPSILIKDLMLMGIMSNINQNLDEEIVTKLCQKYNVQIKVEKNEEQVALSLHEEEDKPEDLKYRSPVVTIMGHVDHGKTSILDAIRKSKVAESEHGGITQHIGAYRVKAGEGEITFLDTPGHEAFTAMRARGAKVTDIVVVVVAADDGVMPQTKEAIDHAKAAGVCIIVALNKMDKPGADPDRVKKQLSELDLLAEDWGGKTVTVGVSAKTGQGINELLEMILLEAQMLDLKANPTRLAKGIVLEAKLVKNRGPVVTLLVQNGTLHLNDNIIVGNFYGKIRAMFNDRGQNVVSAGPTCPVEVLGVTGVAAAGEQFFVISDEKFAKELAKTRQDDSREKNVQPIKRMGLEDLYSQIKDGKLKELKIILKSDTQGSLEAIKEAIKKINTSEIVINFIHEGVGNINSSDVILAVASDALILGFNVTPDEQAKALIDKEGQDARIYNVIYELVNDIKAALVGMLEPKLKKVFLGKAEVKKVFKLTSGTIAGCIVNKGKFDRKSVINLVRNGSVVYEGELSSLKRFKDDVREVGEGFECGMSLKGFSELMQGDIIEAYEIKKIARTMD